MIAVSIFACPRSLASRTDESSFDVVIYGGTSAAVAAAVQVKRMNGSVIIIEPTQRIGGLTTGGLGQTDIGNKAAIGGISREFYQRIRRHYDVDSNWKWQRKDQYRSEGQSRSAETEDTMWTFEPSVALQVMQSFIDEYNIPVAYGERLDRSRGVELTDGRITSIRMESGRNFSGNFFIDTTYEGDLMAAAGVSCTVGREGNEQYQETLNGVQTARSVHHQFVPGVDPFREKGNPSSGLLPGIDPAGPGTEGGPDHRVQAYCFRMCLTDQPDNRIPFVKPENFDEENYELLFRNFEAGFKDVPWSKGSMPNRKTDINNNMGFSTDFIGQNYQYPEADYVKREQIIQDHRDYQQGLMWVLANHPRVPEHVRREVSRWGTCRDEFIRPDGWQEQLYIREARRMIGATVMTQHHCQGRAAATMPIGLAAYTMDSHNVQRHVAKDGFVRNEGDVQVGGFSPYPIDYGAIVPQTQECPNLFVPVCLSATHIAFGSIRMEPVFMVLGQSSGTAAMLCIQQSCPVQKIDYGQLRDRLSADGQVLEWKGPKRNTVEGIDMKTLKGIVLDDETATRTGFETQSASIGPFVAIGYRHDGNDGKGLQEAVFPVTIPAAGKYRLSMAYSAHSNRATNVPVVLQQGSTLHRFTVNQQTPTGDSPFAALGTLTLTKGDCTIGVSNKDTDGYVLIDAFQLLPE